VKTNQHQPNRHAFWIGFVTGVGLMGALDAIAFHHLLQWHNLYVHAGDFWRSFSDGLLHTLTTGLMLAGFILIWKSRHLLSEARATGLVLAAGLWLGMGVFQFVDGTLLHLVLRLHPVREGVSNLLPYNVSWIGSAVLLLLVGWWLLQRAKHQGQR
jgi:uncharacterized membrane protein